MSHKEALRIVKQKFPQVTRAWWINRCRNCDDDFSIFWIDGNRFVDDEGYIQGGFYCPKCDFSNAGKCEVEALL